MLKCFNCNEGFGGVIAANSHQKVRPDHMVAVRVIYQDANWPRPAANDFIRRVPSDVQCGMCEASGTTVLLHRVKIDPDDYLCQKCLTWVLAEAGDYDHSPRPLPRVSE